MTWHIAYDKSLYWVDLYDQTTYSVAHVVVRRSVHVARSPVEEAVLSDRLGALVPGVVELVLGLAQEGVIKLRSGLTHFCAALIYNF